MQYILGHLSAASVSFCLLPSEEFICRSFLHQLITAKTLKSLPRLVFRSATERESGIANQQFPRAKVLPSQYPWPSTKQFLIYLTSIGTFWHFELKQFWALFRHLRPEWEQMERNKLVPLPAWIGFDQIEQPLEPQNEFQIIARRDWEADRYALQHFTPLYSTVTMKK